MNKRSPNSKTVLHHFNLLEICLALVIIAVGVVGLMGLFPIGANAGREAISNTSAADAGDQFLRLMSSKMKMNWNLANAIPLTRAIDDESTYTLRSSDSNGVINSISGVQIYYNDLDNDGAWDWEKVAGSGVDDSGVFRLKQNTDTNISDFDCIVRVWRKGMTYRSYSGATGTWTTRSVEIHKGCTLVAELSYPATVPYERRTKRVFQLDVFNPETNPATDFVVMGAPPGELPTYDPPTFNLSGDININPNNSNKDMEFTCILADGSEVNRDMLKDGYAGYTGVAVSVWFKPKGNGNKNSMILNGVDFELENSSVYSVSGSPLNVRIYNKKASGNAMGQWYMYLEAVDGTVTIGSPSDTTRSTTDSIPTNDPVGNGNGNGNGNGKNK